jgi:hypothetical protein
VRGELQELVDRVAGLLGAPATLEDADLTLLAFCAHPVDGRRDAGDGRRAHPLDPRPRVDAGDPAMDRGLRDRGRRGSAARRATRMPGSSPAWCCRSGTPGGPVATCGRSAAGASTPLPTTPRSPRRWSWPPRPGGCWPSGGGRRRPGPPAGDRAHRRAGAGGPDAHRGLGRADPGGARGAATGRRGAALAADHGDRTRAQVLARAADLLLDRPPRSTAVSPEDRPDPR